MSKMAALLLLKCVQTKQKTRSNYAAKADYTF